MNRLNSERWKGKETIWMKEQEIHTQKKNKQEKQNTRKRKL